MWTVSLGWAVSCDLCHITLEELYHQPVLCPLVCPVAMMPADIFIPESSVQVYDEKKPVGYLFKVFKISLSFPVTNVPRCSRIHTEN